MATKIQAIRTFCPKLDLTTIAGMERFLELLTLRTTLSIGVVKNVQESEIETLTGLLLEGQSVHTGTAVYTPSIGLDGKFEVNVRPNARLVHALNAPAAYRGPIRNAENIGKTSAELVEKWNQLHPEDPIP